MVTLVTISFSHYCEKARWALDRAGVVYTEAAYVPGTHLFGTVFRGGKSTPLLVVPRGRVLTDSTDIVRYADEASPGCLLPDVLSEAPLRREVDELEELFDEKLGSPVRVLVYDALLESGYPFDALVRETTTGVHRALAPVLGFAVPRLVRRGLGIHARGVARAIPRVEAVLQQVEARLADGRRYLAGDRFTAADLTFASLLAPMVGPPEQPVTGKVSSLELIEPFMRETRARPAGLFALRLYTEERARGRDVTARGA